MHSTEPASTGDEADRRERAAVSAPPPRSPTRAPQRTGGVWHGGGTVRPRVRIHEGRWRTREVVEDGPGELLSDLLRWHVAGHQVPARRGTPHASVGERCAVDEACARASRAVCDHALNAVGELAFDGDVQRMNPVAIGSVHVRLPPDEVFDQLNVPAGERVVQRRATAAVLAIVGVGAVVHQQLGNMEACTLRRLGSALACCHLVQAAVEQVLAHTCTHAFLDVGKWLDGWHRDCAAHVRVRWRDAPCAISSSIVLTSSS